MLRRVPRGALILLVLAAAACERAAPTPDRDATGRTTGAAGHGGDGPALPGLLFLDATADLGIDFSFDRATPDAAFMPDSMTPGCALLDADGDGDLDVYLVNGFRAPDGRLVTPEGANRLYRQDAGGTFTDVTATSGAGHQGYGMGVATGDVDNDGDVDLYVTCYGPDALLLNRGDGTFDDVSVAAGITNDAWSASATMLDYDGDGFLDVYVTNYLAYDVERTARDAAGRPEYAAPHMFDGVPDVLYRNNGDGTFTDVSAATGIASASGHGLGVVALDIDRDGRLDLYVANDGDPNIAWMNTGTGFVDEALARGLALSVAGEREAGMGIAVGDADGDGDEDLLVTHLVQETNTLYRHLSGGVFEDATAITRLGAPSVDATAFGAAFLDVDLDGDLDLIVANGRVLRRVPHAAANLNAHWTPYAEPNQLFVNEGATGFREAKFCGAIGADVEVSRGLASGDLDGDGDLDVVISNANGTVKVYRNETERLGHWLIVRAVDPDRKRDALGAVVEVNTGRTRLRRTVRSGESYLSARDPRAHFGLGAVERVDGIVVEWPDGTRERFDGGPADRVVEVRRGQGTGARG